MQNDGSYNSIYANRYVAGSGWEGAQLLESNTGNAAGHQIAVDKNGNAIAVWFQNDGTRNNIFANRYTAGTGWEGAQTLESDSGEANSPKIAIDNNCNAIVVWTQSDGSYSSIYANRFVYGSGWEGRQLLETYSYNVFTAPSIVMNSSGTAFVISHLKD